VFNEIEKKGIINGFLLFFYRMKRCKPGYSIEKKRNRTVIRTSNNYIIEYDEINPFILK